jgi:uncharacterized protein (TIGR02246 family)
MKYLMILTVGVCLLFAAMPVMAQSTADEAAVREAEEKYIVTWNAHDAKALCATNVENSENWEGTRKGKVACEKAFEEYFAGSLKNFEVKLLDEVGIVFVAPDVAIYKARYAYSGTLDDEGKASPPGKTMYARVYVKKDGKWLGAHGQFNRPIEE